MLLLVCQVPLAIEIEFPQLASRVVANITDRGQIEVSGGRIISLELNSTIPQPAPYQSVDTEHATVIDAEGNYLAQIKAQNPESPYSYEIFSKVTTTSRGTYSLPESYTIPPEAQMYLQPAKGMQSGDPQIRELARSITANSTSSWEAVSRLAIWVHNYVEYDESQVGLSRDALWVLENKRGVCVEYTTLFMALAKSVGIPVRYVAGYTYSGKYGGWLGHAWAEAYIGKWVPVDPTWLEAGRLGAAYIEVKRSADITLDKSVAAIVSPPSATISLIGDGDGSLGKSVENVKISSIELEERSADFSLESSAGSMRGGEGALVIFTALSGEYKIASLDLVPCTGQGFINVSDSARSAIFSAGERKNVVWEVKSGAPPSAGVVYTCPLTLNSQYYKNREIPIRVDPRAPAPLPFEAWVGKSLVALNASQQVFIRPGGEGSITVIGEHFRQSFPVSAGALVSLNVTPERLGRNWLYAYSDAGNYRRLEYEAAAVAPIGIERVSFPKSAFEGSLMPVRIALLGPTDRPAQARLTVSFGKSPPAISHISLLGRETIEMAVRAPSQGRALLTIELEAAGLREVETYEVAIVPQPRVRVLELKSAHKDGYAQVTATFETAGNPQSVSADLGGVPLEISQTPSGLVGTARVPYGKHKLTLGWRDSDGNAYSFSETVGIPQPSGVLGPGGGEGGQGGFPCLPAALALMVALGAFAFARGDALD